MVKVLNIKRDTFDHAILFNHNKHPILFNHLEGIAIPFYGYPCQMVPVVVDVGCQIVVEH